MGIIFDWLTKPTSIADDDWSNFLNYYAPVFLFILAVTVAFILFRYWSKARDFMILRPSDVFAKFHPMLAVLWSIAGGLVTAIEAIIQYHSSLSWDGLPGFVCMMFFLVTALSALISYLFISFSKGLTPAKFRHRAGRY